MSQILVVEDEKIIAHSLQKVLSRSGHSVSVAKNGIEAIEAIERYPKLDLLFVDLLMPELGGGEVLDFSQKKLPSAKVIMMTAYGDSALKEDLIRRGASMVLSKPFEDITKIPALAEKVLVSTKKLPPS